MSLNAGDGGSSHASHKPAAGGVIGQVVSFFRSKGLSDIAIAGILGNMRVESGFRTGAYNAGENAIGLVQWEGGRRANLQRYASQRGTSETDLNTQLNFLWHELTTSYGGALEALRNASTPADAAAIWDSQYEVSAGTTRGERVNSARSFYNSGLSSDGGGTGSADTGSAPDGSGAGAYAASAPQHLSRSQYRAALGQLSGVIQAVPELKGLLDKAIASGQPTEDFVNAVQNSKWYRTHSDTFRSVFSLRYSDPAEFSREKNQMVSRVKTTAASLGVHLNGTQALNLAEYAFYNGLDDTAIQQHVAGYYTISGGNPSGTAATTLEQLRQLSAQYGVPVTNDWLQVMTKAILAGTQNIDGARENIINHATSLYPALTQQLKAGQTTQDVAQPYIAQMSQTLEIPDGQITLNDPTIKRALQYRPVDPTGKAGDPQLQPLWQFENNLRQDPRWDQTNNAKQEAYGMLHQLGQSFGFAS